MNATPLVEPSARLTPRDEVARRLARFQETLAVREGDIADFTRIFSLGTLPRELARAYDVALRAQEAVKAAARPGVPCTTVWAAAETVAEKSSLAAHFMGHGEGRVRFVGHGVGLELDELPILGDNDLALAEGMVFALEPKFVLPGFGAIGVENTFVMRADGLEALTSAPEHVVDLAA